MVNKLRKAAANTELSSSAATPEHKNTDGAKDKTDEGNESTVKREIAPATPSVELTAEEAAFETRGLENLMLGSKHKQRTDAVVKAVLREQSRMKAIALKKLQQQQREQASQRRGSSLQKVFWRRQNSRSEEFQTSTPQQQQQQQQQQLQQSQNSSGAFSDAGGDDACVDADEQIARLSRQEADGCQQIAIDRAVDDALFVREQVLGDGDTNVLGGESIRVAAEAAASSHVAAKAKEREGVVANEAKEKEESSNKDTKSTNKIEAAPPLSQTAKDEQ